MPISSAVFPSEKNPAKSQIELMVRVALESGCVTTKDLAEMSIGLDEQRWKDGGGVALTAGLSQLRKSAQMLWSMIDERSKKVFQHYYFTEAIRYMEQILNNLHSDGMGMPATRRKVLELNAAICQELKL